MGAKDDWQDLIAIDALEENWVTRVDLGARALAVYDTPNGVHVSLALCTHGGADLCDGYFDGHIIECPLHQGAFDGRPVSAPATRPLKVFRCRQVNGRLQILL